MNNINSNIETFLDYYCNLKYPPEYAVLLKGSWGTGKTWFIKRYCDKLKKKKHKYLYVSLYGMATTDEIEDAFFQQLHPVLSSKGMAIAGKIIKGVLKSTLKIDWDNNKKEFALDSQIPDINFSELLNNTVNCILIFDDLERCSLDIENILGYINYFVEHQGLKVIIVANEDQIISTDAKRQNKESYAKIKEKLIGKTFQVAPDVENALNYFIDQVDNSTACKFLKRNICIIKEIYFTAGYENLRHLKQALWDFERLFINLQSFIQKKEEVVKHLLQELLAFSFEIRRGDIHASDIGKISQDYYTRMISKEKEKTNLTKVIEKYGDLNLLEPLLTGESWVDFLDKGIINQEKIKESLLNSRYFQNERTPNWIKLWHYYKLKDNDFEALLNQVERELLNNVYDNTGIIKHITGLLLLFSDIGIYKKDKSAILHLAKKSIDYIKSANKLLSSDTMLWESDSYAGLGFAGKDFTEFKDLTKYIENQTMEAQDENMPKAAVKLLDIMKEDVNEFFRMISQFNSNHPIYFNKPIFKHIDANIFVDTLLSIEPEKYKFVFYALSKRYQYSKNNKWLIEELPWLNSIKEIMQAKQNKLNGKISGYMLNQYIKSYLDNSINNMICDDKNEQGK